MSEEIGPQVPAHLLLNASNCNEENEERESVPEIGPQVCDSIERSSENDSEDSENNLIGPMLSQGRAVPNNKKRVIGPAVMPPPEYNHQEEEKEEEDIIGPILPKDFKEGSDDSSLQKTIQEFDERAERMRKALEPNDQGDKPLQRGEWMLVPPETKFLGETPTNMRSRQFKKRAQDPSDNNNSLWTETPAERGERLKKQATSNQKRKHVKDEDEPIKYSRIDLEMAEKVKEYNELYRPKSLLETHSEDYVKSRKWQGDDASKRSFDREKDVLGTRRMDSRKRKEFLDNAKGLGSKFGHGKHGSFL